MALSQIQCLDENHVNPRTHESKPEFFYCEDQRLALEVLLQDGRETFLKFLEDRGLRGFLSDLEQDILTAAVQPFDPDSELFPEDADGDQAPLSLQYWPELSDTSVPQMDLGWPSSDSYRGVTRTTVYTQPPLDGQAHIKEVVRKMIAQAQKVIAVVMDVFTDVDIFRDLLDAAFKRKVSVYILLERTTLPLFLSMCQRASMHAGHLKHLRVRCTGGAEFYTRRCTKVRGRTGHRFMFIDGDKAVSGSYSFTWMSSRLDRNLITVITGQAADAFDQLFRFLYLSSSAVDLHKVATEPEPEPEHRPQVSGVTPPLADVARKLYNPKYALVALCNPGPITSVGNQNSKEPEAPENSKKKRRRRLSDALAQDAPPLHPGLTNLEKANLIPYLPIWPEPDPPSDVIGFINVRDASKPTQVHLQRSEMFETSQAIKFSSPLNKPQDNLPEVATPRRLTVKHEKNNKPQPAQHEPKATELVSGTADVGQTSCKDKVPEPKPPPCSQTSDPDKDEPKVPETVNKLSSNTVLNPDSSDKTAELSSDTQSSNKVPLSDEETPTNKAASLKPDSLTESNSETETKTPDTQSAVVAVTHTLKSNSVSQLNNPAHPKKDATPEKAVLSHADSHTKDLNIQPKVSSEVAHNLQNPSGHDSTSSASPVQTEASTSLSQNNPPTITTEHSSTSSSPSTSLLSDSPPSSLPPPVSRLTTQPSLTSSASTFLTSLPPVPKPRTVQLVFKGFKVSNSQMVSEVGSARRPETSTEVQMLHDLSARVVQTCPGKKLDTVPEVQGDSKTGSQKDTENQNNIETQQQKQCETSQEKQKEAGDGQHPSRAGPEPDSGTTSPAHSDALMRDLTETNRVNIPEIITKGLDFKTLKSTDSKTHSDFVTQTDTNMPETLTNHEPSDVPQYLARSLEPQRISFSKFTSQASDVLEATDSLKSSTHNTPQIPNASKHNVGDRIHTSAANRLSQQGEQAQIMLTHCTDSVQNPERFNTRITSQEQTHETQTSTNTPAKLQYSIFSPAQATDSEDSPTAEPESQSAAGKLPDSLPPRPPTPDSRTTSPNSRSFTPDFQTPTSDLSDGYISPKQDSTFSNTSEEYYECCDSPSCEPVLDLSGFHNPKKKEQHISVTYLNSPAHLSYNSTSVTADTADLDSSSTETSVFSRSAGLLSSSFPGTNEQNIEQEDICKIREEDEIWIKRSNAGKTDQQSQEMKEVDSQEAKETMKHLQHKDHLTANAATENDVWVPVTKDTLIQPTTDKVAYRGETAGSLTGQETEPKQMCSSDPQLGTSSQGERPRKASSGWEKVLDQGSLKANEKEAMERQSTRVGRVQKRSPSKPQRLQLQDSGSTSSARPVRTPQPPSGSRDLGVRQTENKVFHTGFRVLEKTQSPHRSPSRPVSAGPVGSAAGRKQVPQTQQNLFSRQPQIRSKPDQPQSQTPKSQHYHHAHSNPQLQVRPPAPVQKVTEPAACEPEERKIPFNTTFSRLYNFKGLRDRWTKLPAQSKRSTTKPPVKEDKGTS